MEGSLQRVVVSDVRMSFGAMVVFMVKWVMASIPALLILSAVVGIVGALFGGLFMGMIR